MDELIRELKAGLSKEKTQIVDILILQIEAYEAQLKKVKEDAHVKEQLRQIDELDAA